MRKAAFLDRDGVINLDRGYVCRWAEFEYVPGAVAAMRRLQDAGYALVIVTNQSGIARGMYTEHDFEALSATMREHLDAQGVRLLTIEHCPHHPKGTVPRFAVACECRKPAPGMLLRAARSYGLALPASILFGDKSSDIEAARRAGVGRRILVATNGGLGGPDADNSATPEYRSLADAVEAVLAA